MRIVFLGTPEPAGRILDSIVAAGHEVLLVITRPDAKRGRGGTLSPSPVKEAALRLGIPVSHELADLDHVNAELGVVVAYGAIISAARLEKLPMLNVHFSLLPRWRGAAPVERCILAGDEETGVDVMTLEPTLDTGPIHLELVTKVADKSAAALLEELTDLGAQAIVKVLNDPQLRAVSTPQSGEATYAAKLTAADFRISPSLSTEHALRVVRLGRTRIETSKGSLRIVLARVSELFVAPGQIRLLEGAVLLGCADGALELLEVLPSGSRIMSGSAWWAGVRDEALDWSSVQLAGE